MPLSAHDVARELREQLRGSGVVKVHKLLYYCQGWHLAWTGEPMFREPIEAWANGPVVGELWRDEKRQSTSPPSSDLDASSFATLRYVVSRYGDLTGRQLIALTHQETPWRRLSESDDDRWATLNPEITHDALRDYFGREDDNEVTLRRLADQALADPRIRAAVTASLERAATNPGEPDDLGAIRRTVAARSR